MLLEFFLGLCWISGLLAIWLGLLDRHQFDHHVRHSTARVQDGSHLSVAALLVRLSHCLPFILSLAGFVLLIPTACPTYFQECALDLTLLLTFMLMLVMHKPLLVLMHQFGLMLMPILGLMLVFSFVRVFVLRLMLV